MQIRKAQDGDVDAWVKLRHLLWPHHDPEALRAGAGEMLESQTEVCFVATVASSGVVGFIEGAVHAGPKGPYGHIEGWYVLPEFRRQGYGKELVGQFEGWCLHRAICLLTSDTDPPYSISPAAHEGCGFRQIHELKIFMKELQRLLPRDQAKPPVT